MTVRELLQTNEEAGLKKFEGLVNGLEFPAGPKNKLLSMFKAAFAPSQGGVDIVWDFVKPLDDSFQIPYETLKDPENPKSLYDQLILVKLNGGLGTTMGCTFPKSIIKCTQGKSFLDITIDQLVSINKKYNTNIPLVLMNSFYTDDLMKEHLPKSSPVEIFSFLQNKFPKILEESLEPLPKTKNDSINYWNPPGHGDVFHSLRDSGLLDQFLSKGKHYMLVSNIDNLGGIPDIKVMNKIVSEGVPFLAETVTKLKDDWKGGMPIMYKGKIKLLETAQVPKDHFNDFTNMDFLNYFNANNLWVDLRSLKKSLDENTLILDVIKNNKVVEGKKVIQIEAASGSAIQSFPNALAVRVPRRRFLPVKSCCELLIMRGGIFEDVDGVYNFSPKRKDKQSFPSVKLSAQYNTVQEYEKRVPHPVHATDLIELVVEGDVTFEKDITLIGKVEFKIPEGVKIVVPSGKVLKDVVITKQEDL